MMMMMMKVHMISMGKVQTQSEGYESDGCGDRRGKKDIFTFWAMLALLACATSPFRYFQLLALPLNYYFFWLLYL